MLSRVIFLLLFFCTGIFTAYAATYQYVYVSNWDSTVSAYAINQTSGVLTSIGTPVSTGVNPMGIAVDPFGRFVYVSNFSSSTVSAYAINPASGALTSAGTVATGSSPTGIAVDPSGRFAYVSNQNSSTVSAYSINQTSGALTAAGTVATGSSPTGIAIDPSGRFAYAFNQNFSTVSAYGINQTSGALTFIGDAPTGMAPLGISIDPSGRFTYVSNQGSNTVSAYSINQTSGALTSLGAVAAGVGPTAVTVSPIYRHTITYNGNGSSGGTVPTDPGIYVDGATVTILSNSGVLVKTGYTFSGWNTAADGSGTDYAPVATFTISDSTTLYAKWIATVTYNGNTNSGGTAPTDASNYLNGDTVTVLGNSGTLTKTGFTFFGWNTLAEGSGIDYAPAATFTISGNTYLYAKWTATVTYNGNGNSGGTAPTDASNYLNGDPVTLPGAGTLTRAGYTFVGWNTLADGNGTTYLPAANFVIATDTTLYAKWVANGVCGSSNAAPFTAAPASNLCSYGTPSAVSGTGPWRWTCAGDIGGTTASCSAYLPGTLLIPKTGQTTCSDADGNDIPCAGTGQDGDKRVGALRTDPLFTDNGDDTITDKVYKITWQKDAGTNGATVQTGIAGVPVTRFTDNADGTITDNLTGLVWLKKGDCFSSMDWEAALNSANRLVGNNSQCSLNDGSAAGDWRLPNINELASVATNRTGATPAEWLNTQGFTVVSDSYWSSSSYSSDAGKAWSVGMADGQVYAYSKSSTINAWLVRSGEAGSLGTLTVSKSGSGTGSVGSAPAGISCGATCSSSFAKGESVVLIATADSGSGFANWSGCDSSAANQCTVSVTGAKAVTVTFTPTYTVTYDGNSNTGGTVPVDAGSPYLSGSTVTVPGAGTLTRTGYTFAGWNSAANGSGTSYAAAATFAIAANTTLYAKWTINSCTISFNTNDGGTIASQSVNYNSTAVPPSAPTRIGYTFAGWYSEALLTTPFAFTTPITDDTTLYAKWTIKSCMVSFNTNDGGTIASQSVSYNSSATVPTVPTRTGYTFAGWYSEALLTTPFAFTTPITADTTLYAKWTITIYAVTPQFTPGVVISPATVQSVEIGKTATFTINAQLGYGILAVSGCDGSLSGNIFTTGALTGNCTVSAIAVKHGTGGDPVIAAALKAFQAYSGTVKLTPEEIIKYDVAPVAEDGVPQGDGVVDLADVIMLLRRSVGIGN